MKPWLNIPQKTGAVYTVPVEAIINHRAAVCWSQDTGDRKYPVVRDETIATFEADPDAIASWMTLNMPWDEVRLHTVLRTPSGAHLAPSTEEQQDALLGLYGLLELDDKAPPGSDLAIVDAPLSRPPFNFEGFLIAHGRWSYATFGRGPRTGALIEHCRRELKEIEARPFDLTEWTDLIFLAFDGARRHAEETADPESLDSAVVKILQALTGKFEAIQGRSYPAPDPAGEVPTEHIRTAADAVIGPAEGSEEIIIPRPSAHH